jgi:hypothetical protein
VGIELQKFGGFGKMRTDRGWDDRSRRGVPTSKGTIALRSYLGGSISGDDTISSLASKFGVSTSVVSVELRKLGGLKKLRSNQGVNAQRRVVPDISNNERSLIAHVSSNLRPEDTLGSLSKEFDLPYSVVQSILNTLGGMKRLRSSR